MRLVFNRFLPACALILVAGLALIATPAAATGESGAPVPAAGQDFRTAVWGQSRQQVRRQEAAPPQLDEGPLLAFPATVAGQPCQVIYLFDDDKLCMGFYQWSDTHEDLAPYFDDARSRRSELAEAWGEPQIERWDWEDPLFAKEPELRAEALGLGLVKYELGWMTGRSIVALRMSGGNLKADLLVMYADRTCFPAGQELFRRFFARAVGVPTPYYR